jgi:transcriptional regulator with XRE-family HTH domain
VTTLRQGTIQTAAGRQHHEVAQLGIRLRAIRTARKLTLTQLAELSGVPASTISKIENGQLLPSLVNAFWWTVTARASSPPWWFGRLSATPSSLGTCA